MNKKLNTLLFIVAGTLLNIILMVLFIVGLGYGSNALLRGLGYEPNQGIFIVSVFISIFGGMALAFVVYNKIVKFIQNKYDLEKYLSTLFKQKRR